MHFVFAYKLAAIAFILLINVKMPTIDSLTFISIINCMFKGIEHEKKFTTSMPGCMQTTKMNFKISGF